MIPGADDRLIWRNLPNVLALTSTLQPRAQRGGPETALLRRLSRRCHRVYDNPTWTIALNSQGTAAASFPNAKPSSTAASSLGASWTRRERRQD